MKVVIWGYKLYKHSHSFINYGFYRAFDYLGYNTWWLSDEDDVSGAKICLYEKIVLIFFIIVLNLKESESISISSIIRKIVLTWIM
jgi:hypothetical protein